jgi:menaquinone-specific isochorismate synthase
VTSSLTVRTTELPVGDPLLDLLPADADPVTWLRRDEGLVGWGVAAQIRTRGLTRFSDADKWWTETCARAEVHDAVNEPGSGLVCFGTFGFADDPGDSVLTVPRVVIGRRAGRTWLTLVGPAEEGATYDAGPVSAPVAPEGVVFADGALDSEHWMAVVAEGVRRIEAGDLEKVVLARDLVATAAVPIDVRWPLARLATTYPMCWTFHVDGMFGATPEMLVRRERGLVTSRVLAGTIRRTGADERDLALAATLARSSKDLEEHEYAVRSVADALEPHCSSMNVPEAPFVLHLPNVMHLASDVAGVVHDASTVSSLHLAASLHPSAAVGGTPTADAVRLISELEGMDRGRYAGPVGWMDTTGDGEWGIALRSAEVSGDTVRLFAGCGIVADSDPEAELAEAQAKFVPVRDSLAAG